MISGSSDEKKSVPGQNKTWPFRRRNAKMSASTLVIDENDHQKTIPSTLQHSSVPKTWYVRLPLWAQTTILILVIGLTSIIVLVAITATKVYHYSETLITNQLENMAGMAALQLERLFSGDSGFITLYLSNSGVIQFFEKANSKSLTIEYLYNFPSQIIVDSSSTSLWGITFYDSNVTQFYNWQRRGISENAGNYADGRFPSELYPLSFPESRGDTIKQLNRSNGSAFSKFAFTALDSDKKTSIGYSITQMVFNSSTPVRTDAYRTVASAGSNPIGYITFVFFLPLYPEDNSVKLLPVSDSDRKFDKYHLQVIRERDIMLNESYYLPVERYYGITNTSTLSDQFRFLFPQNNEVDYPISEYPISYFPVVTDAVSLAVGSSGTGTSQSSNYSSLAAVQPVTSRDSLNRMIMKIPAGRDSLVWDEFGRQVYGNKARYTINRANSSSSSNVTATPTVPNYNLTATSTSTSSTPTSSRTYDESVGLSINKPAEACLSGKTLINGFDSRKISIGYSYSNIQNELWLVFVVAPKSVAFTDIIHVVYYNVYVGVGVLCAVLLIMLPLSRWQTRGVYVIYNNMRLRPLFTVDQNGEFRRGDEPGTQNRDSHYVTEENEHSRVNSDSPTTVDPSSSNDSDILGTNSKSQNSSIDEHHCISSVQSSSMTGGNNHAGVETSSLDPYIQYHPVANDIVPKKKFWWFLPEWLFNKISRNTASKRDDSVISADDFHSSHTNSTNSPRVQFEGLHPRRSNSDLDAESSNGERYRFTIPLPLPQLNRWYTDELDELIDEFNLMVETLNNHYHHIEDQVKLRTREAQRAGELREKANLAKSEFIAIISHELRTPLNGIMGLTAVNAEETDIHKIRNGLEIIIDSGRILMDLLNELLVLSKSLVGVDPSVTEFTPNYLLGLLSNVFLSRTSSHSANYTLGSVPQQLNSVQMMGDIDHVIQICVNFMSNADKFSDRNGNVSVVLHLKPLDDPNISLSPYKGTLEKANAVLEILVTDSGTGISTNQLGRIFDLFVQGDNPLRKNHKGAGLGMALSKQLAEGIGGYVKVFSAENVGTTIALRVPVFVMNCSSEDMLNLYGPLLEFKIPDVYSTVSITPGEVKKVQPLNEQFNEHHLSSHHRYYHPFRSTRHSRQPSIGSRTLLSKSGHSVTRLMRSQSTHHPRHSNTTSRSFNSKSSDSMSNSRTQSLEMDTAEICLTGNKQSINSGSHEAVLGSHPGHSTNSFFLNIPKENHHLTTEISSSMPSMNASESSSLALNEMSDSIAPESSATKQGSTAQSLASSSENITASQPLDHANQRSFISRIPPSNRPYPLRIPSRHGPLAYTDQHASSDTSYRFDAVGSENNTKIDHMRVLLAEDNSLNQQIMVKMLQQLGVAHVDTADDGNTVVTMVENSIVGGFHYDVIFMDLSMPGKNGFEATQTIRGTLGYPYPIVALTGFGDVQTRSACAEVNIEEVLTKPIMKDEILRVLRKYSHS